MRRVEVVAHDPRWPGLFRQEAEELQDIFGGLIVAIHHIGSTSVPGLSAKPVIDVLPVVRSIEAVDGFHAEMERRGYTVWGEYGLPGRRFFTKGGAVNRTHNIHFFQRGDAAIQRHLAFRDYLTAHAAEAEAYAELKRALARQFPTDIEGYMDGKDAFIQEMQARALAWTEAGRPGA
jgi:GrpB-like predicted nucleotidyltransferase (UPF0157 family)